MGERLATIQPKLNVLARTMDYIDDIPRSGLVVVNSRQLGRTHFVAGKFPSGFRNMNEFSEASTK